MNAYFIVFDRSPSGQFAPEIVFKTQNILTHGLTSVVVSELTPSEVPDAIASYRKKHDPDWKMQVKVQVFSLGQADQVYPVQ